MCFAEVVNNFDTSAAVFSRYLIQTIQKGE
jgi:hypothetical protein